MVTFSKLLKRATAMYKKILSVLVSVGILFSSQAAQSSITIDNNVCVKSDIVLAHFNGVNTTIMQAVENTVKLKNRYGATTAKNERVNYHLLYNKTAGLFGWRDFIEVFEQRAKEQGLMGRYEYMISSYTSSQTSFFQKLKNLDTDIISLFGKPFIEQISKGLFDNSQSFNDRKLSDYKAHQASIDKWVLEGKKLVYLAHSQGNLFANNAYDYTVAKTPKEGVGVIHIAPASAKVNGKHFLASVDIVIDKVLRLSGTVPPVTHNFSIANTASSLVSDITGHGLFEVYLEKRFPVERDIEIEVKRLFSTLEKPKVNEYKSEEGLFNITLNWDGLGDVDLHIIEPTGNRIYFNNAMSDAGYLDFDNTYGFGPEHYYASCDANKVKTGTYSIGIANFRGAEGRTATVQVASMKDGVIGTSPPITLGAATGDNLSTITNIFNIQVLKKETDGTFEVEFKRLGE